MGDAVESVMAWGDAYCVKVLPLGGCEGVAFHRDVVDIVRG